MLRIPGVDAREAQSLGTEIAAKVARTLLRRRRGASVRSLAGIDLRLRPVDGESRDALVERVVDAIVAEVLR